MPTITMEKALTGFNKNEVIDFAVKNLKKKKPTEKIDKKEIEQQINKIIEFMLEGTGHMAKEIGGKLANIYGAVPFHFAFDGERPFTPEEKQEFNLMGHSNAELRKALNKIRGQQRKKAKAEWDQARREEISFFQKYFFWYLEDTRGPHKRNKLDVIVGVGDDIVYEKGHYKRIF